MRSLYCPPIIWTQKHSIFDAALRRGKAIGINERTMITACIMLLHSEWKLDSTQKTATKCSCKLSAPVVCNWLWHLIKTSDGIYTNSRTDTVRTATEYLCHGVFDIHTFVMNRTARCAYWQLIFGEIGGLFRPQHLAVAANYVQMHNERTWSKLMVPNAKCSN